MNEQYPVDRTRVVTTHVGSRSAEWLIAEAAFNAAEHPEHGEGPMSPEELIAITRGEHFEPPAPAPPFVSEPKPRPGTELYMDKVHRQIRSELSPRPRRYWDGECD